MALTSNAFIPISQLERSSMDPFSAFVLPSLIGAGSNLLGGIVGGIGAQAGARRQEIGRARHAAKLDDLAQMLQQRDPSKSFAPVLASLAAYRPDASGAADLRMRADRLGRTSSMGARQEALSRQLAASQRSMAGALGASGSGSGALSGATMGLYGQAIASFADQAAAEQFQREQASAGLAGQAAGLDQQSQALALQALSQQAGVLQGIEGLRQNYDSMVGNLYSNESFASPRYNSRTGEIDQGK